MPILYNGQPVGDQTLDPNAGITYMGVPLSKVTFNNVTVWESATIVPQSNINNSNQNV